MNAAPPLFAIAGPTASGKSALALDLARERPVEIVCVDSAQVYRGMAIGTAAPTAAERAVCPHHLVGIRDPARPWSAAAFLRALAPLEAAIRRRGKTPLLVGGTMLYLRALGQGLADLPPADPGIRASIDALARREGWPAVHARLAQVDPETAARLAPHDAQRLQRALEVHRTTGRPLSAFLSEAAAGGEGAPRRVVVVAPGTPGRPDRDPEARAWRRALHERIAVRFRAMLSRGLIAEVAALHLRGDLDPSLPAVRAVGYRQLWAWLDGELGLDAAVEAARSATRQLAKRQITWLRSLPDVVWLGCDRASWMPRVLRVMDRASMLDSTPRE